MTEIVVARRDGTILNKETGERYRAVRGKTLAHANHPAVVANPEMFMPMTITLSTDSEESADADTRVLDDVRASLERAEGDAERYREQLVAIATGMHERGLIAEDVDTDAEGWLATAVFAAIDSAEADSAQLGTEAVAKPTRSRRKPTA